MIAARYPYTYAADFIRAIPGPSETGTVLSRSDASQIRQAIAEVLGMSDEDLAKRLADRQLAKTDEDFIIEAQHTIEAMVGAR